MKQTTETKMLIGVIAGFLMVVIIFAIIMGASARITEADRRSRSTRHEACVSIQDEAVRTLCLRGK